MKNWLSALLVTLTLVGCGPQASGATGTLDVVGGPYGRVSGGELATLIISVLAQPAMRVPVTGGVPVRILLAPGTYLIRGEYGDAGCSSAEVQVRSGAWASFEVRCDIR